MKRVAWGLVPMLVIGMAGCQKGESKPTDAPKAQEQGISVAVATAETGKIARPLVVEGTIAARSEVKILPKMTGRVLSVLVDEGSAVKTGQKLAMIESPEMEWQMQQQKASLLTAQANLSNAQSNLDRMRTLVDQGAISQQQYEQAQTQTKVSEAQVKQIKAAIRLIETQQQNATVTSPIDGIVIDRSAEIGVMAMPSSPLFTIAGSGPLELQVNVPEQELASLKVGAPVKVESAAFPGQVFNGKIREVSPSVDPQTRQIKAKIDLGKGGPLKVGMFVSGTIQTQSRESLLVPTTAIQNDGIQAFVYLEDEGKAKRVNIQTGIRNGAKVEVLDGLSVGAPVVIEGGAFLKDGSTIVRR
ncbi:Multidrug resistance protein MdtA precursor [compost metagenome]